jgi:hypothetical protein
MTEIVVSEERIEFALDLFDWHVDEEGYVVDEEGEYAPVKNRDRIQVSDIGYFGKDDDGNPILVEDTISEIVDHLSDRDHNT